MEMTIVVIGKECCLLTIQAMPQQSLQLDTNLVFGYLKGWISSAADQDES